jgi:2-oxo-4-hydroxy-4-carboxy-5-ureidoimidazoline decarboxylase
MSEYTIDELNGLDERSFVDALGEVYETSPWVAKRSRSERPFDSLTDLDESMRTVVGEASRETRLDLLCAHPDLGERTEMTDASESEQASAGLDELSPDQYERFQRLNETYRDRFGFPFIMTVKNESPDAIRAAMQDRIENSKEEEFQTALDQVHEIARLRLEDMLS